MIELMIVVAIVAILAAVALPSYRDYVMRGYVVDATTLLSSYQAQMERYYQDNRSYASSSTIFAPCDASSTTSKVQGKFTLSCTGAGTPSSTGFTLTATGTGPVAGFVYTVDQTGTKTSTFSGTAATGWINSTCWVTKRGQTC